MNYYSANISKKVHKELTKILPTGASKSKKLPQSLTCPFKKNIIINKKKVTFFDKRQEQSLKPNYLRTRKEIKNPLTFTRTELRKRTQMPISPLELSNDYLQTSLKCTTSHDSTLKAADQNCNIEKVNDILIACSQASTPRKLINRSSMRKFTKNIKNLIGGIGDYFATPPESLLKSKSKLELIEEQKDNEAREALKIIRNKVKEFKFRNSLRLKKNIVTP